VDRDIWVLIRNAVRCAERRVTRTGRRASYSDRLIVLMYFWCVWHDRPLCWACVRGSYGTLLRPRRLPSVSQFCRRVKSPRVEAMIRVVNERLASPEGPVELAFVDGKALPVTENTRDPDARTGRGNGRFSRGYKLHALVGEDGRVLRHKTTALNAGEPSTAAELLDPVGPSTLLIGDGNYDSSRLYRAVKERGGQLLTRLKGAPALKKNIRRITPARRGIVELWRSDPKLCLWLMGLRGGIERAFSAMSTFGGGLAHLPPWVRRQARVDRWVTAKLAIYHARLILRQAHA
jgi:IS5 family transposase